MSKSQTTYNKYNKRQEKRPSFSEKISNIFGYISSSVYSHNNSNNNNNNNNNSQIININKLNNNNNNKMAQESFPDPSINHIHNNKKKKNKRKKHDEFDTKHFDKIDYIIQLPITKNPSEEQSRFLVAMHYNF